MEITKLERALLRRAAGSRHGASVWEHGDAHGRAGRLVAAGFLVARPHEWGKDWMRYPITEKGLAAINQGSEDGSQA